MTSNAVPFLSVCPRCGHTEFAVTEAYVHIGTVDADTGILHYDSWPDGGGRDRIACAQCEAELSEDAFAGVEHS